MSALRNVLKVLPLALCLALLFPHPAYGYIDPGTGSYVFQIFIAAFVAVAFAVKVYWYKLKSFVVRLFNRKKDESQ